MTVERIDLTGMPRDQRFALRKQFNDVTASRMGAVFSADPYCSPLRLFHEKARLLELPDQADNAVMRRGRLFEDAVANAVAEERPAWRIEKAHVYLRDPELRMGATPDFFIHGDPRGLGILQTKTTAPSIFMRDWKDGSQLPFQTTLQVLTEAMLADAAFCAAAALKIDAYDVDIAIVEVPRHPASEQRIRDAVRRFWQDVAAGREPGPDYNLDRDLIAALHAQEAKGASVDLAGDNEIIAGLIERADLKDRMRRNEARCKAIETMVMARMGEAETITGVDDFKITWRTEHRTGYTVASKDMRILRIHDRREKEEAA